jgi:ketosteroid isomerase-like protein
MSRENVELLRQSYEALNRAFASGEDLLPVIREGTDPDLVVEMGVLEGTFHGPEGFKDFIEGQLAIIQDLRSDPDEFIDAGDRVVVPFRLSGRAKKTGIPIEYHYVHVWTFRGEKAVHLRLYASKAKALEAVGLSE